MKSAWVALGLAAMIAGASLGVRLASDTPSMVPEEPAYETGQTITVPARQEGVYASESQSILRDYCFALENGRQLTQYEENGSILVLPGGASVVFLRSDAGMAQVEWVADGREPRKLWVRLKQLPQPPGEPSPSSP